MAMISKMNIETFDVLARELVNGSWFFLSLFIGLIFLRFILSFPPSMWRRDPVVAASIGLVVYHFGSALTRGWLWLALVINPSNGMTPYESVHDWARFNAGLFIGGPMALIGATCVLRSFLPWRGSLYWSIAATAMAVSIPLLLAALD